MPRRSGSFNSGLVTRLCVCLNRTPANHVACPSCWHSLPRSLQQAWLAAKDGDCDSGPALEAATAAIRDHLREARR